MECIICADFGSTYTKLAAVDVKDEKIIGVSRAFTTIHTHVLDGFYDAFKILEKDIGKIKPSKILAASSAAGGLKMVAVGLVPSLTAKASKLAASSAGAKVAKTYSYELSRAECEEIYALNPDIILLSGGIDGGNKEVILKNAEAIASIDLKFPVITAGNKSASEEAAEILKKSGKQAIVTENVMPRFNELNIAPAKAAIRDLFIQRIIEAKGLSEAQKITALEIMPTPLAVFEACELMSKFGELMAVDVGGATTDVYSMASGMPTQPAALEKGVKEPFAKRTVEGDLGVRYSMPNLLSEVGTEAVAERAGVSVKEIEAWRDKCQKAQWTISEAGTVERRIDDELAACCVEEAFKRHCGFYETAYTPLGEVTVQTGKDLTGVKYVIGAGGSVTGENSELIMRRAVYSPKDLNLLKPKNPKIITDRRSALTAVGLLSRLDKTLAQKIAENEYGF